MVCRLIVPRVSVDTSDLLAFELDPAIMLRTVLKCDLDLDHLVEAKDDLCLVPCRLHLSLKEYIDLSARFQGFPIQIIVRVKSLRKNILIIRILAHFLSDLKHLVQLFNSLFAVIGDPVDLILVNDLLLLIDVLPVDDTIAENLQSTLVVWEARVLSRHRNDQVVHVLAL